MQSGKSTQTNHFYRSYIIFRRQVTSSAIEPEVGSGGGSALKFPSPATSCQKRGRPRYTVRVLDRSAQAANFSQDRKRVPTMTPTPPATAASIPLAFAGPERTGTVRGDDSHVGDEGVRRRTPIFVRNLEVEGSREGVQLSGEADEGGYTRLELSRLRFDRVCVDDSRYDLRAKEGDSNADDRGDILTK